ncbi:MAG: hypothetical protein JWM34_163 [Ilumatobacteraceae bacterium]|nr:hypothetical protein [Ilumatobacteraceae bacterium]
MGFLDKVKKAADDAKQLANTVKGEIQSHQVVGSPTMSAAPPPTSSADDAWLADLNHKIVSFLGFDPYSLVDAAEVSNAVGFAVRRDGYGGGDYEAGPLFRATADRDDRDVSYCFSWYDDPDPTQWNARDAAENYVGLASDGSPPIDLPGIGDQAWKVSDDVVVVLVRGRMFYVTGSGTRAGAPSTDGLVAIAALVAAAVPG